MFTPSSKRYSSSESVLFSIEHFHRASQTDDEYKEVSFAGSVSAYESTTREVTT